MYQLKQRGSQSVVVATFIAVSALLCMPVALAGRKGGQKVEPDYTKGEKLTAKYSQWALGSTGASGNLWGAGQDNQTGRTRTIQIVDIKKGTPADGKLMKNDVILGVKFPRVGPDKKAPSGHFSGDAAKALSASITEAEKNVNGGSVYQYQLAGVDHGKYKNWSTTGSRLLQHCLPRKQLYIAGKGGSSFAPITGAALKTVVDAATFNPSGRSVKELLSALGNWSLIVREAAAKERHSCPGTLRHVDLAVFSQD